MFTRLKPPQISWHAWPTTTYIWYTPLLYMVQLFPYLDVSCISHMICMLLVAWEALQDNAFTEHTRDVTVRD
jgi:hypothetical protein